MPRFVSDAQKRARNENSSIFRLKGMTNLKNMPIEDPSKYTNLEKHLCEIEKHAKEAIKTIKKEQKRRKSNEGT